MTNARQNIDTYRRKLIFGLTSFFLLPSLSSKKLFAAESGFSESMEWLLEQDSLSVITSNVIDGEGRVVEVSKPLRLKSGKFKNIIFKPANGYKGSGPIFIAKNGEVFHDTIVVEGFYGPGCKVFSDRDKGNSFIAKGVCSYSNNGGLRRTTITKDLNLLYTKSIPVMDSSLFSIGDFIWIGDGKFKVIKIVDNVIELESDPSTVGVKPKVYSGGYDDCKIGQYVTLDANDHNGIRIGNGGFAWNIDTSAAKISCSHNSRAGFYHYCKKYYGVQKIENITAIGNGYNNIGLGVLNKGYVKGCISKDSSNNCIDIYESKKTVDVFDNETSGSGVDGIFVGGNGETARVYNNVINDSRRVGVLINARKNPISDLYFVNNKVFNSGVNSLTLTAVESGVVQGNELSGGILRSTIFIEKRNGLTLKGEIHFSDNNIAPGVFGFDIATNYSQYSSKTEAKIKIKTLRKLRVYGFGAE